jgi:hypothetical protein
MALAACLEVSERWDEAGDGNIPIGRDSEGL